jgi:hypothetical protein
MAGNAALHSKPDGGIDAHGGEENTGLVLHNDGHQSHNEPEGSIGSEWKLVASNAKQVLHTVG